ncbi:MAG: hypothetical protein Q9218_004067 [Villophora microphyllina]
MCFFKVDPKHAPIKPPGAAPTLTTLEEHYRVTLAGEGQEPEKAVDKTNPTSKSIAKSLDVNDKLEPNRPVRKVSAVATGKRKMSVPPNTKAIIRPRPEATSLPFFHVAAVRQWMRLAGGAARDELATWKGYGVNGEGK